MTSFPLQAWTYLALSFLIAMHESPMSLRSGVANALRLKQRDKNQTHRPSGDARQGAEQDSILLGTSTRDENKVPGNEMEMEMSIMGITPGNLSAFSDASGSFKVMQYNILAKALGNNREPWFMFGAGLSEDERKMVKRKHQERGKDTGQFVNVGFDSYAKNLSSKKRKMIDERNKLFDWDGLDSGLNPQGRGERLAQKIAGQLPEIILLEEVDMLLDDEDAAGKTLRKGLFSMIDDFASTLALVDLPKSYLKPKKWLKSHFQYETRLEGAVYEGYFARRTKSSDGVAILWRKDRFHILAKDRKEFSDGDRIFGMALLQDYAINRRILAIGTHLERNPEDERKEAVRRRQIEELLEATSTLKNVDYDAVILAGDMNSDALEERWEVAVELLRAHADMRAPPFAEVFEDEFQRYKKAKQLQKQGADYDPESALCTSRTEDRTVLIDYIFYSPHSLNVVGKSGPANCPKNAIPDEDHPSDHIPIVAEFAWGPAKGKSYWEAKELAPKVIGSVPLDDLIGSVQVSASKPKIRGIVKAKTFRLFDFDKLSPNSSTFDRQRWRDW